MGDLNLAQVSEQYYDVLKELGNIGAGNAMTALSQMLNCKIDMRVPKVELLEFSQVGEAVAAEGMGQGVEDERVHVQAQQLEAEMPGAVRLRVLQRHATTGCM